MHAIENFLYSALYDEHTAEHLPKMRSREMTHLRRRNSIAVVVVGEQLFRPSWSFQLSFIQSATIGLFTRQQKNKPNYTHNQGEYRSPRIVRREAKRETYRTGELGAPGRLASRGGMGCQRKMRLQSKPPT